MWNNGLEEAIKRLEEHLRPVIGENPPPKRFDARDKAALRYILEIVKKIND